MATNRDAAGIDVFEVSVAEPKESQTFGRAFFGALAEHNGVHEDDAGTAADIWSLESATLECVRPGPDPTFVGGGVVGSRTPR
ncbi:MAG: hypothetical protein LH630_10730 [Actinomycetia bacterium]|nr:hypothetical protein [Actinomycetes bacterium]